MYIQESSQYLEPTRPIFVAYRRADAPEEALCLFYGLTAHFGKDAVFMDIDSLGPGDRWRGEIPRAAYTCRVMLVVIGPQWLTVTEPGTTRRRLDNPDDLHRREIAAALSRGIRVVPVLVDGASLPHAEDLPDDLRPLLDGQAYWVTQEHRHHDISRLATRLERDVPPREQIAAGPVMMQASYAVPAGAATFLFAVNPEAKDFLINMLGWLVLILVIGGLIYGCYKFFEWQAG